MPGITVEECFYRRTALVQMLREKSGNAPVMAIVGGYNLRYASGPQNTDMLYLSGFDEPNAALAIAWKEGWSGPKGILFCEEEHSGNVAFHGTNIGIERARMHFGVSEAFPVAALGKYVQDHSDFVLFSDLFSDPNCSWLVQRLSASTAPSSLPLSPFTHKMRSLKSPGEVSLLRKACSDGARAFNQAARLVKPGLLERQLASELGRFMVENGSAGGLSYDPVVAGGHSALVLHYVKKMHLLKEGDLVLVDAGALNSHYRSDISRTWPVSGRFSGPQSDLYTAVLEAQKQLVRMCRADLGVSISDLYVASVQLLYDGLKRLGFRVTMEKVASELYPHGIGHHLGLDLHDCPEVHGDEKLVAGNVITIEPGLYIPDSPDYPEKYRGLGIRLEDDVLVGPSYSENLTSEAAIEAGDVECLFSGRGSGLPSCRS